MTTTRRPTGKRGSRSCLTRPVGELVDTLAKPVFKKRGFVETRILAEWERIVGQALATHTRPQQINFPRDKQTNGTLTLKVAPGWSLQVQHLEPVILDKLATFFGYRAISGLRLIQAPVPPARKPAAAPSRPTRAETTPPGFLSDIPDPALRETLEKLWNVRPDSLDSSKESE